jgi:hypothetical protein
MDILSPPIVDQATNAPEPPADFAAWSPDGRSYPVLRWGGYTYWPFTAAHNMFGITVGAFDSDGTLTQSWTNQTARYVTHIVVDAAAQTVTFAGQGNATFLWDTLIVAPKVVALARTSLNEFPLSDGLVLSPNLAHANDPYPVVAWGPYTVVALSYVDGRNSIHLSMYDHDKSVVLDYEVPGTKDVSRMTVDTTGQLLTFVGQSDSSVSVPWDDVGLVYGLSYEVTAADILTIASALNLECTIDDAAALADALPILSFTNCGPNAPLPTSLVPRDPAAMTVGAVCGTVIGAFVGGIIGGPYGAAAGAAIGGSLGVMIGEHVELPPPYHYDPSAAQLAVEERTYAVIPSFGVGPLSNGAAFEDVFRWHFPRYGELANGGAVAPPKPQNLLQVYYPVVGAIQDAKLTEPMISTAQHGTVAACIFVVIAVPGRPNTYQMRIHPTFPALNQPDRINHSQLAEGLRWAAMIGLATMQVYAAGTLWINGQQIVGIDARTGHYYFAVEDRDDVIIDAAKQLLRVLGYDTQAIVSGAGLRSYLADLPQSVWGG